MWAHPCTHPCTHASLYTLEPSVAYLGRSIGWCSFDSAPVAVVHHLVQAYLHKLSSISFEGRPLEGVKVSKFDFILALSRTLAVQYVGTGTLFQDQDVLSYMYVCVCVCVWGGGRGITS